MRVLQRDHAFFQAQESRVRAWPERIVRRPGRPRGGQSVGLLQRSVSSAEFTHNQINMKCNSRNCSHFHPVDAPPPLPPPLHPRPRNSIIFTHGGQITNRSRFTGQVTGRSRFTVHKVVTSHAKPFHRNPLNDTYLT